ncbi:MAG TPA: tyrosine-type recombinase/integrase, partial [Streptosporangiaceae bacterium]|nr:tyrosine-type recombinase/integrase [Streptosporangiaceae bacterium]
MTDLLPSWELALDSANKSPRTIISYTASVRSLGRYLREHSMPDDIGGVEPEHIRAFLRDERERTSAATAQRHYRSLHVWFAWLEAEGELAGESPMRRVEKPKVPQTVKPFLTDDELTALLRACEGTGFEARRDMAIMRVLIDTGLRVSGLAGLRFTDDDRSDVWLAQKRLRVTLKGGDVTYVPIGRKTAAALDRYLRSRVKHARAASPWLWLGVRTGARAEHFTDTGSRQMRARRGRPAGVADV